MVSREVRGACITGFLVTALCAPLAWAEPGEASSSKEASSAFILGEDLEPRKGELVGIDGSVIVYRDESGASTPRADVECHCDHRGRPRSVRGSRDRRSGS